MMSFCVVPVSWCATSRVAAPLLLGDHLVEREQPHRGRVDRHRRVHLGERDAVEQRAHVAEVRDRHADLADLAAGELVVGVVAGLRRQVEGDRQPGLALGQVAPVERVGLAAPRSGRRRCASPRAGPSRGRAPVGAEPSGRSWRRRVGRLRLLRRYALSGSARVPGRVTPVGGSDLGRGGRGRLHRQHPAQVGQVQQPAYAAGCSPRSTTRRPSALGGPVGDGQQLQRCVRSMLSTCIESTTTSPAVRPRQAADGRAQVGGAAHVEGAGAAPAGCRASRCSMRTHRAAPRASTHCDEPAARLRWQDAQTLDRQCIDGVVDVGRRQSDAGRPSRAEARSGSAKRG